MGEAAALWVGVTAAAVLMLWVSSRWGVSARVSVESFALAMEFKARPGLWVVMMLSIGNGLCGLGGGVFALVNGAASAEMGLHLLYNMIAALLIGEGVLAIGVVAVNRMFKHKIPDLIAACIYSTNGMGTWVVLGGACVGACVYQLLFIATISASGATDWTPGIVAVVTAAAMLLIGRVSRVRRVLPAWAFHGAFPHA